MARRKSSTDDSDVRAELNADFVTRLKAKWQQCGDKVLNELAEKSPEKFALIVSNVLPKDSLIPGVGDDSTPRTSVDIANKLLVDTGCILSEIDDEMRTRALAAFDIFQAELERIKVEAYQ